MILDKQALSMAEANEYISEDSETDVKGFVNKFVKLKPDKAKELRKKLEDLELIKMREEHMVKLIDLLPENAENVNKIFSDATLDEDETKKILDTIKEYQ